MNTLITTSVEEAASFIKKGGITAFGTETVYGLGADILNRSAIARIFDAKRRPADNPLIAHIASLSQLKMLATEITPTAERFIKAFFPGPLTVVLKKTSAVPEIATAGLDTIGIRMPSARLARELIEACETPLVAPSANLSGRPSPTTWQAVKEDLDGRIDCILIGDPTEIGIESTVVDCTGDIPLLLRKGAVTLEQLREIVSETAEYIPRIDEAVKSPGLLHKHYSPRAKVVLIDSKDEAAADGKSAMIGIGAGGDLGMLRPVENVEEYARSLFEFFRDCDRAGIETIYCLTTADDGIGAALMDRLYRASKG